MVFNTTTPKELWVRQEISPADINYGRWERRRSEIIRMAELSRSCIFTVDVYKGVYDYASGGFTELFGMPPDVLDSIPEQGDFIAELIHPDDRTKITDLQVRHAKFIYLLPPESATTIARYIRYGCAARTAGI